MMAHIKTIIFLCTLTFLLFFSSNIFGQEDKDIKRPPQKTQNIIDRIFFGGNIGLSLGSYTYFSFSPIIGFKVTNKLSVGTHLRYDYINNKQYNPPHKYTNYGASIFSKLTIFKELFLHLEYEMLNIKYYSNIYNDYERIWIPHFYVGGGYSQQLGGRSWINVHILYDLIQDPRSPYQRRRPVYQVSFNFGV